MFQVVRYVCLVIAILAGLSLTQAADADELNGYTSVRTQFVAAFQNPYDASDIQYGYADRYDWYLGCQYVGSWDNSSDMIYRWTSQGWIYLGGNYSTVTGG